MLILKPLVNYYFQLENVPVLVDENIYNDNGLMGETKVLKFTLSFPGNNGR